MRRNATRAIQKFGRLTVNKLVVGLLSAGLPVPGAGRSGVIVLEAPGRKSGILRRTPMGNVQAGPETLWVVSEHGGRSDWYRNARAAGEVTVLQAGKMRSARVRLLPDEDPRAVLRRLPRMVAAANRALWFEPAVVEIELGDRLA